MRRIRGIGWVVVLSLLAASGYRLLTPRCVLAQAGETRKPKPVTVRPPKGGERPPREMTMAGRIVSVPHYMTGEAAGDATKPTADSLRAGGAAALEAPGGLVLLGQGNASGVRTLIPFANQEVEVHGMLYEKSGLRYLDFDTIHPPKTDEEGEEEEEEGDE